MRQRTERIYGPEQHGRKYRLTIIAGDGTRSHCSFESQCEAEAYRDAFRLATETRTVGVAVNEYLDYVKVHGKGGEGLRKEAINTLRYRLVGFLRLVERDRPLVGLTPAIAEQLYRQRTTETKPDTHRAELAMTKRFVTWCIKQRWIRDNPFEAVEPIGRKSRGKPQLRVDEARQFLGVVLADASPAGTAVAMALLLGLRASEIVNRVVRDLDDGGKLLWIPTSKTRAGIRQLVIPEVLRERMLALAASHTPETRLFGDMTRGGLHYHVVRFCRLAGVPRVTPHGLRGMHATLAVSVGVTVDHVARALGHAGTSVTRQHYIADGTESTIGTERVLRILDGGPVRNAADEPIESAGDSRRESIAVVPDGCLN